MARDLAYRTGRCSGYKCSCPSFVVGKKVGLWLLCVREDCGHTQQNHAFIPPEPGTETKTADDDEDNEK